MNLLIFTQKVDSEDAVFSFFHRWIEKFSRHFDKVNVVCLMMGRHSLPPNVKVWSLGKETGKSRIKYITRFYKYIWNLRHDYDGVFVHMNPVYAVMGGIFWKLWGKKFFVWHNHQNGNLFTRIGITLANAGFYTSPFSFNSKFKKSKAMPAGIDTEIFSPDKSVEKKNSSVLYVGRISPIKKIDVLIEAVQMLNQRGTDATLNIVGEPAEEEQDYFNKLKEMSRGLAKQGKINFLGRIPNSRLPKTYNQNRVLVNLSPAGLFDKTVLEAMACKSLVLASSNAFKKFLPRQLTFKENSSQDLKSRLAELISMDSEKEEEFGSWLRDFIINNHNLDTLSEKVAREFQA